MSLLNRFVMNNKARRKENKCSKTQFPTKYPLTLFY